MTDRKEQFPRIADLPAQSPLFWVEQKDRYLRQLLIRDIQDITKRRLVVYFANRYEAGSEIDHRDCSFISEIFGDLGDAPVDLLLETNGGNTDAAESIITYLKNITADFRVVVANGAKSNGTLIALAAKSIVMGATSELGPIEPAVQGIPCSILTQPQIANTNFALHMMGSYALQQSKNLARKLLSEGMMQKKTLAEIDEIVQKISSRDVYSSHGASIDFNEAKSLGLAIDYIKPDDDLWRRIWLLYCMYDFDAKKSRYLKFFEGQARSTAIAAPPKPPTA